MSIEPSTVKKIAKLARIDINDEEMQSYVHELQGLLNWVEQLNALATDDVEPLSSVVHSPLPLRADEVTEENRCVEVLANAPAAEFGCYVVPKVVE